MVIWSWFLTAPFFVLFAKFANISKIEPVGRQAPITHSKRKHPAVPYVAPFASHPEDSSREELLVQGTEYGDVLVMVGTK